MPDDRREQDKRPVPDALLEHAEREARGRLKMFLGATPGVGKTWEMLMSGRARKADGLEVVIVRKPGHQDVVQTWRSEPSRLLEACE